MRFAAALILVTIGCHRAPARRLSRDDLERAAAAFYVPGTGAAVDKIARELGPPTRTRMGRSEWIATDGSTLWVLPGDDGDGIMSLDGPPRSRTRQNGDRSRQP